MKQPNFYFENKLWKQNIRYVFGADEVGRGSFAGPIVASVVAFAPHTALTLRFKHNLYTNDADLESNAVRIDDSKKLTEKQRELADIWIKRNALSWGIGISSVSEINNKGLVKATHSAFRRAIRYTNNSLNIRSNYLLLDAFYIPYIRGYSIPNKYIIIHNKKANKASDYIISGKQLAIVKGDGKSFSIAAASIISKVYRDKIMDSLGNKANYKIFGWKENKGYGTKKHRDAIIKYGSSRHHRKKFVNTFLLKNTN